MADTDKLHPTIRPGVRYREADHPGAAKHLALPPNSPEREAKGDLGMDPIADFDPRPTTGGMPFGNLRRK